MRGAHIVRLVNAYVVAMPDFCGRSLLGLTCHNNQLRLARGIRTHNMSLWSRDGNRVGNSCCVESYGSCDCRRYIRRSLCGHTLATVGIIDTLGCIRFIIEGIKAYGGHEA